MQWPVSPARFSLRRMVEISGVDGRTIKRWQQRGTMKVARIGAGTDRAYTLSQALHAAIISQMSRLGLGITGHGADLSDALLGFAEMRLREDPEIARLGPVALTPIPDEQDWVMEPRLNRAAEAGSYVVIDLGRIADGVVRRYNVG